MGYGVQICLSPGTNFTCLSHSLNHTDLNSWDIWYGGGRGRRPTGGPNDDDDNQQRGQRRRKKVTFSTRYSCAVSVANATRLGEYMTLPFDQYSLLDQVRAISQMHRTDAQ